MSDNETRILRVTRSKDTARRSYDRLSRWYDMLAGSSEWKYTKVGLDLLDAKAGEHILEIGFGTGRALIELAKAVGADGTVSGLDISEGMLKIALRKLERENIEARIQLRCGDGARLPYENGRFDAAFMSFTLELFDTPEIPQVLRECARVLKGEGRLCVVAMVKRSRDSMAVKAYEWAHKIMPRYIDCRPILLRTDLERSGFKLEKLSEHKMWGLPLEAALAFKS